MALERSKPTNETDGTSGSGAHSNQHAACPTVLAEVAAIAATPAATREVLTSVLAVLEEKLGALGGTIRLQLADGKEVCVEHGNHNASVPDGSTRPHTELSGHPRLLPFRVESLEREMLAAALKDCRGNVASAARQLGITPRMLRYRAKRLDMDPRRFSDPAT
jgi:DNA-binding NtrC family response regulator